MMKHKIDIPNFARKPEEFAEFIENLPENDDWMADYGFDMHREHYDANHTAHPCGTACCIGGWAAISIDQNMSITEATYHVITGASVKAIRELCYPPIDEAYDATPAQAAKAIRNVIKFDDPKWEEVMDYA